MCVTLKLLSSSVGQCSTSWWSNKRASSTADINCEDVCQWSWREWGKLPVQCQGTPHTYMLELWLTASLCLSPQLFNTAITRARQWLVVVGDPVTLCTVGYNSPYWMELIRKCIEQQTFKYHCPNQFERFLETRVVTRLVLQHRHGQQMTKNISPPSQTAQTYSPPYSAHTGPSVNPFPSAHSGPPPPSSGNHTIR